MPREERSPVAVRIYHMVLVRLGIALRDSIASAVAAALAWVLAEHVFGHPKPIFAAISAIVCLAPGLPSHGRQAVGLVLGVATGIVIGELSLFIPDQLPLLRVSLAAFFAIALASAYGLPPVVPIQAGVSAVLVLALGPATAGAVRMIDVAVGTLVGLIFSQILLTPDPVRLIDEAARDLLERLGAAFEACGQAVTGDADHKALTALQSFSIAHSSLNALTAGIESAQSAVRWSVRGRLAAREVGEMAARYDRHAIRLYASALLFGESFASILRKSATPVPVKLHTAIVRVTMLCRGIARGDMQTRSDRSAVVTSSDPFPSEWQICLDHLHNVEEALSAFNDPDERRTIR